MMQEDAVMVQRPSRWGVVMQADVTMQARRQVVVVQECVVMVQEGVVVVQHDVVTVQTDAVVVQEAVVMVPMS
jgi:hypothetical protein